MKKLFCLACLVIIVSLTWNCKTHTEIKPPDPPDPPDPPKPTEQFVAKMFFHDTGPTSEYDIFSADLYIVPKETSAGNLGKLFGPGEDMQDIVPGVRILNGLEINGSRKERVSVNIMRDIAMLDINLYDFQVRSLQNLTQSVADEFAVNVNNQNIITYVYAPNGLDQSRADTQIFYMNIADKIPRQLTPFKGQYDGDNWDPEWKSDQVIVWCHSNRIVEVDLNTLIAVDPIIPDWSGPQYDPLYSPDGTMLLFNTRIARKKNSFLRYIATGEMAPVLPTEYFNVYQDDNPTWVFSNTFLAGHLFDSGKGRLYTRDLKTGEFLILTDGSRDFRYVSPIRLVNDVYFVFSDWTDPNHITLWVSNIHATYLRELNQTGDEVVFKAAGLPAPRNQEDLQEIARIYLLLFEPEV